MRSRIILILLLAFFLIAGNALATPTNITIYDGIGTDNGEDEEVEPNMVDTQVWDLEGFFLDGGILSMIGGWDFVTVLNYGGKAYTSGDIFIDIDEDAQYGTGQDLSVKNFGYDWVIDVDWDSYNTATGNGTYAVYDIRAEEPTLNPTTDNSTRSDPWQIDPSHTLSIYTTGTFSYTPGLTNSDTGFLRGTHYEVTGFDLSFLDADIDNFLAHFTMECGNDLIIGSVPDAGIMWLLGPALLSLGLLGRRRKYKK
jgi:hypothetical protein